MEKRPDVRPLGSCWAPLKFIYAMHHPRNPYLGSVGRRGGPYTDLVAAGRTDRQLLRPKDWCMPGWSSYERLATRRLARRRCRQMCVAGLSAMMPSPASVPDRALKSAHKQTRDRLQWWDLETICPGSCTGNQMQLRVKQFCNFLLGYYIIVCCSLDEHGQSRP